MQERAKFSSRLGMILVSAGCAIGLGNVWKFPYMCGQYGGAIFIIFYLIFLAILGFPILTCEFAVGRGSRKSCATAFKVLEPAGRKFHLSGYYGIAANYGLMMYYTMVTGWILYYFYKFLTGSFTQVTLSAGDIGDVFNNVLNSPGLMIAFMIIGVVISFGVCSLGLNNGVERVTKVFMICLLVLMIVLAFNSVLSPGSAEGLKFYLMPDFQKVQEIGLSNVIFGAMSQAFFTLSIGGGAMCIFGSYMNKDRTLAGEAINVTLLDTFVAIIAGLIVIPACFRFDIAPDAGPSLIFITLPSVFQKMLGGRLWGTLFFLFLAFAALSTVIAVFENIISFAVDLWGWTRRKAVIFNIFAIIILSLPCILGYNLLSGIQPLGPGSTIMDLEDFIVSNNLLPLGSLLFVTFCVNRFGWGWDNFKKEVDTGKGLRFSKIFRPYMVYILPLIIIVVYLRGYWDYFSPMGLMYLIPWMIFAVLFLLLTIWIIFAHQRKRAQRAQV